MLVPSFLQISADKLRLTFTAPEELDESQLIEDADESDVESESSLIINKLLNVC